MTHHEKRSLDLAQKLYDAFAAVDQPNRNARSMLMDASVWTAVATAIIAAIDGEEEKSTEFTAENAEEGEEEQVEMLTEEDIQGTEEGVEHDEIVEEKPKRGRRKRG